MQLTAEQRAIVEHGLEHCLITAVAGSGKTTTLAWRIRHLLEQGQDPARLLILMFNRSAREDFEHKLAKEGGRKSHTREGDNRGTWILLDYGDIVVHVFQPQARDEYRLEKLWGEADKVRLSVAGELVAEQGVAAVPDLESEEQR